MALLWDTGPGAGGTRPAQERALPEHHDHRHSQPLRQAELATHPGEAHFLDAWTPTYRSTLY